MLSVALISCTTNSKKTDAELTEKLASNEYVFKGTIPAADCPGIEVALVLDKDGKGTYQMHYIGEENKINAPATYEVKDGILIVNAENEVYKFRVNDDDTLTMLDADGNEHKGDAAASYILKREERAFDFVGTFAKKEGDLEIAVVITQEGDNYKVAIANCDCPEECKKSCEEGKKCTDCKEDCKEACKEGKQCTDCKDCKCGCKESGKCVNCKDCKENCKEDCQTAYTAKLVDGVLNACKADEEQTTLFTLTPNKEQTGLLIQVVNDGGKCPFSGEYLRK